MHTAVGRCAVGGVPFEGAVCGCRWWVVLVEGDHASCAGGPFVAFGGEELAGVLRVPGEGITVQQVQQRQRTMSVDHQTRDRRRIHRQQRIQHPRLTSPHRHPDHTATRPVLTVPARHIHEIAQLGSKQPAIQPTQELTNTLIGAALTRRNEIAAKITSHLPLPEIRQQRRDLIISKQHPLIVLEHRVTIRSTKPRQDRVHPRNRSIRRPIRNPRHRTRPTRILRRRTTKDPLIRCMTRQKRPDRLERLSITRKRSRNEPRHIQRQRLRRPTKTLRQLRHQTIAVHITRHRLRLRLRMRTMEIQVTKQRHHRNPALTNRTRTRPHMTNRLTHVVPPVQPHHMIPAIENAIRQLLRRPRTRHPSRRTLRLQIPIELMGTLRRLMIKTREHRPRRRRHRNRRMHRLQPLTHRLDQRRRQRLVPSQLSRLRIQRQRRQRRLIRDIPQLLSSLNHPPHIPITTRQQPSNLTHLNTLTKQSSSRLNLNGSGRLGCH